MSLYIKNMQYTNLIPDGETLATMSQISKLHVLFLTQNYMSLSNIKHILVLVGK